MSRPIPYDRFRERETVNEEHFYEALARLRDFLLWSVRSKIDPWAKRQALITLLEFDRSGAIEKGVKPDDIAKFDEVARKEAQNFIEKMTFLGYSDRINFIVGDE